MGGLVGGLLVLTMLILPGTAQADIIFGNDNNNNLEGTAGSDTFWAYAGNDTAHGKPGDDTLHMGAGNDDGYGGDDADTIFGGASGSTNGDVLVGDVGRDDIEDDVTQDFDLVCGGSNDDSIDVSDSDGQDYGYGGGGDDDIRAGRGRLSESGRRQLPPVGARQRGIQWEQSEEVAS